MAEEEKKPEPKVGAGKGKPEKYITVIINGKERKISVQSQYILDMLTIDD